LDEVGFGRCYGVPFICVTVTEKHPPPAAPPNLTDADIGNAAPAGAFFFVRRYESSIFFHSPLVHKYTVILFVYSEND
jgi:hypothetical protein